MMHPPPAIRHTEFHGDVSAHIAQTMHASFTLFLPTIDVCTASELRPTNARLENEPNTFASLLVLQANINNVFGNGPLPPENLSVRGQLKPERSVILAARFRCIRFRAIPPQRDSNGFLEYNEERRKGKTTSPRLRSLGPTGPSVRG
jgi:hypothetical protein